MRQAIAEEGLEILESCLWTRDRTDDEIRMEVVQVVQPRVPAAAPGYGWKHGANPKKLALISSGDITPSWQNLILIVVIRNGILRRIKCV